MNALTIIYVYLAISGSIIIFNIAYAISYKVMQKRTASMSNRLMHEIVRCTQDPDNEKLIKKHCGMLRRRLKNSENLIAYDMALERLDDTDSAVKEKYIDNTYGVMIYLCIKYMHSDPLKAAFFPYFVKKYGLVKGKGNGAIIEMLIQMVSSDSIFSRENALEAIYSTGDSMKVIEAMRMINSNPVMHNEKLITDGLFQFTGDFSELEALIWIHLDEFKEQLQVALLNFMRFRSGGNCDKMYGILEDENRSDELRFAAIRYFGKYKDERAYPFLIRFADDIKNVKWQYAAISATALAAYPGKDTETVLKKCLTSRDWYVRFNASESLSRLGYEYEDLYDVQEGKDRFAKEMMQYRFDQEKIRNGGEPV